MATVSMSGSAQSQGQKGYPYLPLGWQEPKYLHHYLLPSQRTTGSFIKSKVARTWASAKFSMPVSSIAAYSYIPQLLNISFKSILPRCFEASLLVNDYQLMMYGIFFSKKKSELRAQPSR